MKTFKKVLSLALALMIVVSMLSCAFTTVFADEILDKELSAITYTGEISEKFNVTGANNGYHITGAKRANDVTAVSQNSFYLYDFTFKYYANYNYGVNAANHEQHYAAIGDLKFVIDMGVTSTESIKYKLFYGETELATYDTGLTVGKNDVTNALSGEYDPNLRVEFTVANGNVKVNTNSLGDINWTLADSTTSTQVALPEGYGFSNVNITLFSDGAANKNPSGWTYNVFLVKANALTGKFPYATVDALNAYLADVDVNDEAAVAEAQFLRTLACTGTSAELQAAIGAIGANSGVCVHDYKSTTTATCTDAGVRTYVCSLCNDTYTEDEAAFGHDESSSTANYVTTTTCNTCGETLANEYLGKTVNYKVNSTNLDSNAALKFSAVEYFISDAANDKLTISESWAEKTFSYTLDGTAVTGNINEMTFVLNEETVHTVDTTAGSDTYEFKAAGKYFIYGTLTNIADEAGNTYDDATVLLATVTVRDFIYTSYTGAGHIISYGKNKDLDNVVIGDPSTNAFYLKKDGTEVTSLYYGDTFSAHQWWKDCTDYTITLDGVKYKGFISKLNYFDAYTNSKIGATAYVWNQHAESVNGNTKVMSQTGMWYVTADIEGLKCVDDSNVTHDNIYGIIVGSFKVKTYQGDAHIHDYVGSTVKEPTCDETGSMHYTCDCGEDDYYTEIPVLGHKYVGEVTTAPTCYSTGIETFTCSRCGDSYTKELAIVDHAYTAGYCDFCGEREVYTPDGAEWAMDFVDADGNAIEAVDTINGEFWMVVRLTNYADFIGEMNNTGDITTSTFDRTIAFATTLISMDNAEVIAVRENNKIVYATPYDSATLISNYDTNDGMLKVIFQSDDNAGCTFSVGKSDLDVNNGELFRIKLSSKLTEVGEFDLKFVTDTALVSSSVALVNKATAGAWETGVNYTAELKMDKRGYDTIYTVEVEEGVEEPVGPTYVEGLVIAGKNVAFAADYTMVFAVSKANYEAYDEVYLEVQKKLYDGEAEYEAATLTETEIMNGMYAFRYKNFAAREIASEVQATVYAKDAEGNVYYGPTLTYSMREYAQNQITKSKNAYFKTMMVDFLNYGAAAQTYFGYNTGDLANKNIDAYQDLATKDVAIEDVKGGQTDTSYDIDITNFSLIFKSKITLVFATSLNDTQKAAYEDNAYAKVTYTNFEGEEIEVEIALNDEAQFTKQGTKWCVQYDGVKAREMDKVVTVAIYDNEGNQISNAVTYSVNSYAYSKLNNSNANLVALVNAMSRFGYANQEYNRNR